MLLAHLKILHLKLLFSRLWDGTRKLTQLFLFVCSLLRIVMVGLNHQMSLIIFRLKQSFRCELDFLLGLTF